MSQQAFGLAMSLYYSGTGTQPSFWQNLADIQCPFLVLTGEWDEKFFLIAKNAAATTSVDYPLGVKSRSLRAFGMSRCSGK